MFWGRPSLCGSRIMDVRTVCLGVLTLGDVTGYEIRKMFASLG